MRRSTLKRHFFHYQDLEEYKAGMWAIVGGEQRRKNALRAANLMRNVPAFEAAMFRALEEWPNSCLQNLTIEAANRIAWLGHAGCLLGVGSPEENTRIGWHQLAPDEQDAANAAAERVLDHWLGQNGSVKQLELFGVKS